MIPEKIVLVFHLWCRQVGRLFCGFLRRSFLVDFKRFQFLLIYNSAGETKCHSCL